DHVEVVEAVGDLALELRAATGCERHAVLGPAGPDVLPAPRPREPAADHGAVPQPCGLSRASGTPAHERQAGDGDGGDEDASDALELSGPAHAFDLTFLRFRLVEPGLATRRCAPHDSCLRKGTSRGTSPGRDTDG